MNNCTARHLPDLLMTLILARGKVCAVCKYDKLRRPMKGLHNPFRDMTLMVLTAR